MSKETLDFVTHIPAEKLQNFFGVFLQFHIGVDSQKPLIVTTNLTLEELQHPEDTAHARIYDRLLEMCCPVFFTGENIRKATAQGKMERLKGLMNGKESL